MGGVTAICNGKTVESKEQVLKGASVSFVVQPKSGYEVTRWEGVLEESVAANKLGAKVTADKNLEVTITLRKIPDNGTLTVIAKEVKNISITGKDHIGLFPVSTDGRYFVYDLRVRIFEAITDNNNKKPFTSFCSSNGGNDLAGIEQVNKAHYISKNITNSFVDKYVEQEFSSLAEIPYFELDTKVVGYNRAAFGAWRDQLNVSRHE